MTFKEALKETIDMATAAYKNDQGIVGVPSGLSDLDDRLGGLHKQDLIIIAGDHQWVKRPLQQISHFMQHKI